VADDSATNTAIVGAVADVAGASGVTVVAEGVETAAQRSRLLALDRDLHVQGFHYAQPMPPAELERWVDARLSAAGAVDDAPSRWRGRRRRNRRPDRSAPAGSGRPERSHRRPGRGPRRDRRAPARTGPAGRRRAPRARRRGPRRGPARR